VAVTFDLFGTLVDVEYPSDPRRSSPANWSRAASRYRTTGTSRTASDTWTPRRAREVPLPAHVAHALDSRGVEAADNVVRHAVVAAFDPDVTRRDGALEAVRDVSDQGPVGLLSNCAVPELVPKTLIRAGLRGEFDAVTTSIGCGWRKPHPKAFEAAAKALGVAPASLVHVGDDPRRTAASRLSVAGSWT